MSQGRRDQEEDDLGDDSQAPLDAKQILLMLALEFLAIREDVWWRVMESRHPGESCSC